MVRKLQDRSKWHLAFALWPKTTDDGYWIWFEYYWRRYYALGWPEEDRWQTVFDYPDLAKQYDEITHIRRHSLKHGLPL
jgi:hypothetical protein